MAAIPLKVPVKVETAPSKEDAKLRDRIAGSLSQEVVIAVVGYAGSGTGYVARTFQHKLNEDGFDPRIVKATDVLKAWAKQVGQPLPNDLTPPIEKVESYQNIGDGLRQSSGEYGIVAGWLAEMVHVARKEKNTDGKPQVFILDSLKHPAEVELLRQIYGDGFRLIGVGCRPDVRQKRLEVKLKTQQGNSDVKDLIDRDAEDSIHDYGQQVNKTFHLADYFLDNTVEATNSEAFELPDLVQDVFEKLFTRITHHPTREEQGLYFADAAAMGSACLSRQVGAAIFDENGNLLATGRNDVPKAAGGLYDDRDASNKEGHCYLRGKCSNKVYQTSIIDDIVDMFGKDGLPTLGDHVDTLRKALKKTRMGSLLEFSRSVHAEMDAIVSLARTGTQLPPNSTLYTTTYPCHNCARHIVAAGIKRVVYLEPYTKSLAVDLHDDAIAENLPDNEVKGRVRFDPYQGVAPRLYQTVFRQMGERKDASGHALEAEAGRMLRSRLLTATFDGLEGMCSEFVQEQKAIHDKQN